MSGAADARRCPLCGGENACALARGEPGPCWCTKVRFPADLLRAASARGPACVCSGCLEKSTGVGTPGAGVLTSPRLLFVPCRIEEAATFHALWTRPEVRRYLFDDRAISASEAHDRLAAWLGFAAERGLVLYGVRARPGPADGPLTGFVGLQPYGDEVELLYGTAPERWGQGLATEMGACVLEHAFEGLGLERVIASVDRPNRASIRVLEKLGMDLEREERVEGRPILFYARTRA